MPDDIARDPETRIRTWAGMLQGNFATVRVEEDDDKFVITQDPCGSCGRQLAAGRHPGPFDHATVAEVHPITFDRGDVPVYRTHVAVMHFLVPEARIGVPWPVVACPRGTVAAPCRIHLYKDPLDPAARVDAAALRAPYMGGAHVHDFVPLVDPDDLPPDLRAQWDATTRPGLRDFIRDDGPRARPLPPLQRGVRAAALRQPPRAAPHRDRAAQRVASTTRCPVCMAGRVPAATEAGLTEDLIARLGTDDLQRLHRRRGRRDRLHACKFATDHLVDHRRRSRRDARALHARPRSSRWASSPSMCLVGRFSQVCGLEESG